MASQTNQLTFACTLTQFGVAMATTLPAAGFTVVQAPIKTTGYILGTSGGAATFGNIDFSYDGTSYLYFFGANPVPVGAQTNPGVTQNNPLPALFAYLTTTLAATLGAPVPSNQAVPPQGYPNYP